ncbi:hypothetical protein DITRI_Ditri09bG0158200 [Diplodiscus trichospermus]
MILSGSLCGHCMKRRLVRKVALVTGGVMALSTSLVHSISRFSGSPDDDIRNYDLSDFQKVMDVNVKGVFLWNAARIMIPYEKDSIMSISSVIRGLDPHAYKGSKHAVLVLNKNVAAEPGKYVIRVNCVSPYAVPMELAFAYLLEDERTADPVLSFRAFTGRHA